MGISPFAYQQMMATLAKNKKREPIPADACDDEGELHAQIKEYCNGKRWIALHGSMAHKAMRVRGEWDFIIIADKGRTFLCECKTKTGKMSPEQLGLKMWAEQLEHKPMVVRSFDDFIQQLNQQNV